MKLKPISKEICIMQVFLKKNNRLSIENEKKIFKKRNYDFPFLKIVHNKVPY